MRSSPFRSPLPWLAVSGLVMLLWAWWNSSRWLTTGRVDWGPGGAGIINAGSGLRLSWRNYKPVVPLSFSTFRQEMPASNHWVTSPVEIWGERTNFFPGPAYHDLSHKRYDLGGVLVLPHWLAVAVYGAGWGGLMGWRRRKMARAGCEESCRQ